MLNETFDFDSDAEYRFTGTDTSPKEIVALAMERAGMGREAAGRGMRNARRRAGAYTLN
jgi:hypothetical protein